MIQRNIAGVTGGAIAAALLLSSMVLEVPKAYSEAYIGGQIGTTLPEWSLIPGNRLTNVELTQFSPAGTLSDRELSRSIVGGVRLGYFFPRVPWLGVETEAFYTTPHIKQQNTRITIPPGAIFQGTPVQGGSAEGVLTGDHFRVITWAPVNVMLRYHKTRLQPYAGVGLGVFFARINTTVVGFEGSQSSTSIGLNAKAGLEFYITRHLSLFAEWKYNKSSFTFDPNSSGAAGLETNYQVHFATGGLNYHF
jgi:opacity protein-like surface antigen